MQKDPMQTVPLLIDGDFVASESKTTVEVTNPNNNQPIALAPIAEAFEVEKAVAAAKRAFETWRETPV